ncbi:hypothetical protein QCA50_008078 [Cerrena zonata]|uniref:Uncharacterized protein n=1 Tax=Cerrena zonata TaxID=2478898 RepID=A0AAW0GHX0_9APHY
MGANLEGDDLTHIMRIWKCQNEVRTARVMRDLWKHCPTLQQLDWYPLIKNSDYDPDPQTLCRWRFLRKGHADNDPGHHLHQVVWDLRWKGCPQGNADPVMMIRVGQEWKRELDNSSI